MAAVTVLGTTFNTTSGTHTVTATPAVGDQIIIVTASTGNVSAAIPTDNQGGTYTTIVSALGGAGGNRMMIHVRNQLIPAASSTIFTHAPGASTGGGLCVLKATGMSRIGVAAAKQSAKEDNQGGGGTPAPVLVAVPVSTNPIIGAVFNGTSPATMTPRAGYTERADVGYATPTTGLEVISLDSGEASATITWGSASASGFASSAVELDASPPAPIMEFRTPQVM